MAKVRYRNNKGRFTKFIPNTMLRAEIIIDKKVAFIKRSYFEYDISKEYKEIEKRLPIEKSFKYKGSISFDLFAKDRLWEQIPENDLQKNLRKATSDRIRVRIEGKYKSEELNFIHEFLAPTKQLKVKGSKSYQKKLRANARRRLKQAIMDTVIADITKSKYRMSGSKKINKSKLPKDVKAFRKTFPLLRKINVTVLYE